MERSDIEYLLKNYFRYQQQRESLQNNIDILTARATKISPSFDPQKYGSIPRDNPKPSKVEACAIKIINAQEKIKQVDVLIAAGDDLFKHLRPYQRYLLKCVVCNGMTPEQFAKREGIKPGTVKHNLENIYKKLESIKDQ